MKRGCATVSKVWKWIIRHVYELKDEFTDRDIIMDSSAFGVEGTAALIAAMARARFNL